MSQTEKDDFFAHLESLDVESDAEVTRSPPRKRSRVEKPASTHDLQHHGVAENSHTSTKPENLETNLTTAHAIPQPQELAADVWLRHGPSCANSGTSNSLAGLNTKVADTGKSGIFAGLTFYFIPNDNIAKVRKLRIQSAVSQGATWTRKVDRTITHVIVDSNIPAERAAKALSNEIDTRETPVVKDKWLIECLSYKCLRDPTQDRFQLKGAKGVFSNSNRRGANSHIQLQGSALVTEKRNNFPCLNASNDGGRDELSQIVQEMKSTSHLPFDEELDLDQFVSLSSGDESANDENLETPVIPAHSKTNKGFACMEPNRGASNNPNNRTIEILQQMATYYDRTGDNWRTLAYRKAISALRKQSILVTTKEQAQTIFGIGSRLADKIEEIVTTDRLRRLDSVLSDPAEQILQLFMGIYGCGLRQARLWIDQGYRTLDDLKANATLTTNQQIGIDHYDDFQQRIPRAEVKQHGEIVQQALFRANKDLQAIIGGSYRRGMSDSGDIDIMITHPTAELPQLREWVFDVTLRDLFEIGFMKCALATSRLSEKQAKVQRSSSKSRKLREQSSATSRTDFGSMMPMPNFASSSGDGTKFHGASSLCASNPWRRIDLLLVPASALGASLIYFTGNDIFNRSIRLLASRKGMRLNQHGLYKNVLRGPGRVKETEGELVEGRSEKRIFEILGVPWRQPEERRC